MQYRLLDPPGWDEIPEQVRAELKCGPGDGVLERLVPDVWWFGYPLYKPLRITPSCGRHDAEYRWLAPPSELGRELADLRFRKNTCRQTFNEGGPDWLLRHRLNRCYEYWWSVRKFGYQAFWGDRVAAMRGGVLAHS